MRPWHRATLLLITGFNLVSPLPAFCDQVVLPSSIMPARTSPAMENLNQQILSSPNAASYSDRAAEYKRLGLHKEAADDLEKALTLEPSNALTFLLRAEVFFESGMFPEAVSNTKEAIKIDPKFAQARVLQARSFMRLNEYKKALDDANDMLAITPNSAQGLMIRGAANWGLKKYDSALDDLTNAIKADPSLARAYYYRGKVNLDTGAYQKAVDDFTQSLSKQPLSRDALLGRAWANYKLGNDEAAAKDASAAVKFNGADVLKAVNRYVGQKASNPDITPDPEYYLGEQMEEYLKNALVLFDDVLKDKPSDPDALRDRGIVYMHLGKYKEAIRDFEDANKGMPLNPPDFPGFGSQENYQAAKVEYKLGNDALNAGKYADAFNHYQAALDKYPYYAKCWHNMALACSYLGDNGSAELCAIHSITYRQDDWKLWQALGYVLFQEFQQDKSNPTKLNASASALQEAMRLNPDTEQDKSSVRDLLASVKSYERSLAPVSTFVITTMPIN